MFKYKQREIPEVLQDLFKKNEEVHLMNLRSNKSYYLPKIKTMRYGEKSLRYQGPKTWNDFVARNQIFSTLTKLPQIKKALKK